MEVEYKNSEAPVASKKINTKFHQRRYYMTPCKIELQDENGVVKSFRGRRSADGTRYIPHGEGWRNAEKFAKKRGLKLLAEEKKSTETEENK